MIPFDESGSFLPVTDAAGIRRVAIRGAGVTVLAQATGFAIQMIATVTLARLLTPEDFGLVTMVTTFSLLLMNVGFNGITEAIVQRPELDRALASNLFWINTGVGVVLTAAFASVGSILARFYGDPRITSLAVALSATILLTSVSVVHLALLKRALLFSQLSLNDILARAASVAVAIVFGVAGFGYWALVAGAVTLPLAISIGAFARCAWFPARPRSRSGTGEMVRFALQTYGHFAANYCTRNLDNLLVGWFFGPQSLGFYKKAYDLCVMPVGQLSDPLSAVAIPTLSRVASDPERHRRGVLRALSTLAFVGMGLGAVLALIGQDVILLFLGPQWRESGRIFRFFAPGIGAMLIYLTYNWIHLSVGRADRLFKWGIVEFAVIGSLFLVGLRWGPIGITLAWVTSWWLLAVPALWYAGKAAHLDIRVVIDAVWKYVAASSAAAAIDAMLVQPVTADLFMPDGMGALCRMTIVASTFAALYIVIVILLHRGVTPLREMMALVEEMRPRRLPSLRALRSAS